MFRSDTQRIHAQVVKGRALRDRTHVELVGEPVCVLLSPRSVVTLDGKYAISALRDYTGPVPTTMTMVHPLIKASTHVAGASSSVSTPHGAHHATMYTEYIGRQLIAHMLDRSRMTTTDNARHAIDGSES